MTLTLTQNPPQIPRRMLAFFRRVVFFLIKRLPLDMKIATLDAGLWRLEEISYSRLRANGFRPGGIIDIGAHQGDWTLSTKIIFPDTPFFMIEARAEMQMALEAVSRNHPNIQHAIALLGDSEQCDVAFHVQGSGSSIYRERSDTNSAAITVNMKTLDQVLPPSMRGPLFLKLDVQGAELDILRGGEKTLERSEVVQIELPLLQFNDGAPTSSEIVSFMNERGFALYDISGFVRPYGKQLVQIDTLFVRKNSCLRPDKFEFHTH